ncbi:MAG: hypothetical protein SNJ58_11570 [Aggregatilineales bacterium]
MSHQELRNLLEQLHEKYNERKRRISALRQEIKTDYEEQRKAHNRRNRIKESYIQYRLFSAEDPPEAVPVSDLPPATYPIAESEHERIRKDERALIKVTKALRFASETLRATPLDVVKLARGQQLLAGLDASVLPELPDILERYERILQAETQRLSSIFGTTLCDSFAAEGLTLEGRPPDMYVGRIRLSLDFTKRTAELLYGKESVFKNIKLSAELILKAYRAAYKSIYERQVDGQAWMKRLYEAWRIVRFQQGNNSPDANLIACYVEMALRDQTDFFLHREPRKKLFKEYTRAQFAYDVDLFVIRQGLHCDGWAPFLRNADKAQARSPERSIWIVKGATPNDGNFVSTLLFRKER